MIRMKALRTFSGNEGHVKRGREFTVAHEHRARDLEDGGLAFRLEAKMQAMPENKMEPTPQNKAADDGPLPLAGGETGVVEPQRSLPVARQRQRRKSQRLRVAGSRS